MNEVLLASFVIGATLVLSPWLLELVVEAGLIPAYVVAELSYPLVARGVVVLSAATSIALMLGLMGLL